MTNAQHKHEIILCELCGTAFECKVNNIEHCQCNTLQLTPQEVQFVSENYQGCLCAACLLQIQQDYRSASGIKPA